MKLYHYPKCSTCRKAIKFVEAQSIQAELIDIASQPPSKTELKKMLKIYNGELKRLFNTSGMQYRELNLKESLPTMSEAEAIELLAGNGMLVKRPFLLDGDKTGLLGFKQAEWEEALT